MMDDPRLKTFFQKQPDKNTRAVLIGFPSDEGVSRNGGRPGAAGAPEVIIQKLMKLTPHPRRADIHTAFMEKTAGPEFITCSGDVESDQQKLGDRLAPLLEKGIIPVILGGGHETSFGHFLGYTKAGIAADIINIDAHADVRPLKDGRAHSGSPFRQAITHDSGLCRSYNVFGLNPASLASAHLAFVEKHGAARLESPVIATQVQEWLHQSGSDRIMATMDMDVVCQADAPGVSAPNASGIAKEDWLQIAFELGKNPNVSSFDLCEVNPLLDRDDQTSRLAALTIWNFLLGLSLR
jgi:formiminoglutamase